MRIADPNDRLRGAIRLAAALGAGALVASCSSSSLSSLGGTLPSWFSRSDSATQAQASVPGSKQLDEDCPGVDIRSGGGTLAVAAKPQEPTANDLRYQLTFVELARQCIVNGNTVQMRVGVQGRAIVGPAGAPPQASAPIRYSVVQEGVQPKTIATKFRRVPVELSSGNTLFTDIEEDLSFPMPPLAALQSYVVYVGFDEAGDRGQPKAKKQAPAKAQPQPRPQKKLERSVAPEFAR
jgi:hypothetical protein